MTTIYNEVNPYFADPRAAKDGGDIVFEARQTEESDLSRVRKVIEDRQHKEIILKDETGKKFGFCALTKLAYKDKGRNTYRITYLPAGYKILDVQGLKQAKMVCGFVTEFMGEYTRKLDSDLISKLSRSLRKFVDDNNIVVVSNLK